MENFIERITAFEQGELSDAEVLELFSELLKAGIVNHLQGDYGRTAHRLITQGYLTPDGELAEMGRSILRKSGSDRTPVEQQRLEELVHEAASQAASNAINSGEEVDYLLGQGWTEQEIAERLKGE